MKGRSGKVEGERWSIVHRMLKTNFFVNLNTLLNKDVKVQVSDTTVMITDRMPVTKILFRNQKHL